MAQHKQADTADSPQDDWFIEHFVPCQSRLYRFIAMLVANRADAEDLFQKTALTSWHVRGSFDRQREFFPWLCGIARNHVRHYYSSQRTAVVRLDPEVIDQLAQKQIEEDTLERKRQHILTRCMEKLPARQKDLVEEYYGIQQTIKAFAESRGQTPDAVYKTLQRIRAALFDCIQRNMAEAT